MPPAATRKVLSAVARLFRPLERLVRPRLLFMQNRALLGLVGAALVLDGFYLALPWPPVVPLSNTIPAWMALIKVLGLTEEDGIAMLIGLLLTAVVTLAGLALFALGWELVVRR